jgi:chromate transporter
MTDPHRVGMWTIAREWGRIGVTGFGGPPAHITLLRELCVDDRAWLTTAEFEDAIAAVNLLPGPASTQLSIYCAWRLRGGVGGLVGGACFIVPGLLMVLGLSALFLASNPPRWVEGAAGGAGAAIPAVAVAAALALMPASWRRAGARTPGRVRWLLYAAGAGVAAATIGPFLVVVILFAGLVEVIARRTPRPQVPRTEHRVSSLFVTAAGAGGLGALAWTAFKVGALSYGGGFVIIPLMQHDAISTYRWMTGAQFNNAVAIGQVTPGPVVHTVAVVGYAAAGVGGALLAALVAFAPSFAFVLLGARHLDRLRDSHAVQSFLTGAGAAAIGAIAGSAIPLGRSLVEPWQLVVLVLAFAWLLALRRSVVLCLLGAGGLGIVAALAGATLPH